MNYTIKEAEKPPVVSSFTANKQSPQLVGTEVTLTANATGTGKLQYKFLIKDSNGSWALLRNYEDSNTYVWKTGKTGDKVLYVDVKDSNGQVTRKSLNYTVADNPTINVKSNITIKQNAKVQVSDIVESATDWKGNDITSKVSITGLDTSVVGTQKVTVSVTDSYGYVATKITNVKVIADTPVEKKYKVNSAEYKQIMNKEVYRLIAELRAENGSPAVGIDDGLQTLARLKNEHMIQYKYFDHSYNGVEIGQLYPDLIPNTDEGADYRNVLENLYIRGDTLDDKTEEQIKQRALSVFTAWKNSGIHHATMVDKFNTLIGFDYTVNNNGTAYATLEAYGE